MANVDTEPTAYLSFGKGVPILELFLFMQHKNQRSEHVEMFNPPWSIFTCKHSMWR